ncbi:uncharacterized protein BDR25DRAFT_313674 [Lindgomyces ingoldianus]|uniref:Uncharacterized protein n=1 Tax=Lindgomyces ingoldianus TaxID=673940 RepID=A0ACB6QXY8_9PLEO|nr:uncharacterized protein BDR25DRAFT_313674 [Lindgomyces ingoldianus]KAF2471781.1 hypothetical protein BDR25DRAFT_313674 [Lindgomyces ingoldianus]
MESPELAQEPLKHQRLEKSRKTRSWDRVVVYDPESGNVNICKERDLRGDKQHAQLEIPKGRKEVCLFVDEAEKLKTVTERPESKDIFLARLTLLSCAKFAGFLAMPSNHFSLTNLIKIQVTAHIALYTPLNGRRTLYK